MLYEVKGDILLSTAQLIAHGVAPNDDFHTGLALSLRERWPAMYSDFRHHCHGSHPKTGEIWTWSGAGENGAPVRLVALFTQEAAYNKGGKPGPATTENVNHALRHLRQLVEKENIASVALPKLATGVGGLDWDHVRPLIERNLGKLGVPIFVYTTYQKGVAAKTDGVTATGK